MRYTLNEMTSAILRSLESDQINSITDTEEALAVAELIRETFYDMSVELNLPEHETLFQLNASGDNTKPCLMSAPTNVTKIRDVKYDKRETGDVYPDYKSVEYIGFGDFLSRTQSLREDETGVSSMTVTHNGETFTFLFRTNKHPSFYTTADDQQLLFDSYDSAIDTTLQKSKTLCSGNTYQVFSLTDTFVPDLDPTQFPLLLQKAKVRAHFEFKQTLNQEANGEARRQKVIVQERKRKTEDVAEVFKHARYGR
jgi:hypothetical protein